MDIKNLEKVKELNSLIRMCDYITGSGGVTIDGERRYHISKHSHPILFNALVASAKVYKEVLIAQLASLGVTYSEVK